MKKFIKNNIKILIGIFISGILFTGIGVYATTKYLAKDVSFTPSNNNFKVENVEDALNELYSIKTSKEIYNNSSYSFKRNINNYITGELDKGKYRCFYVASQSTDANSEKYVKESKPTLYITNIDDYQVQYMKSVSVSGNSKFSSSAAFYLNTIKIIIDITLPEKTQFDLGFTATTTNSMVPVMHTISCIELN